MAILAGIYDYSIKDIVHQEADTPLTLYLQPLLWRDTITSPLLLIGAIVVAVASY